MFCKKISQSYASTIEYISCDLVAAARRSAWNYTVPWVRYIVDTYLRSRDLAGSPGLSCYRSGIAAGVGYLPT